MSLLIDIIRLALALSEYSHMATVPDPDHADIAEAKGLWYEVERQVTYMVGYCDGAPNWDALGGQLDHKRAAQQVKKRFTDQPEPEAERQTGWMPKNAWLSTEAIPF